MKFRINNGGLLMGKSKRYHYEYEDYEENGKDCETLAKEILEDSEIEEVTEIIIGNWGGSWEEEECDPVLNMFAENSNKFSQLESLFVGDMDYEDCEVSWIVQGNYENLLKSLKNLKHLKIKGSNNLTLGQVEHQNLESIEIICGGLPKTVINELANAKFSNLKKINLYFGVEDYGFDASIRDIEDLLKNPSLKNLEYLGLGNSEIQDEIINITLKSDIIKNLKILDFSNGTTSDKGAKYILENFEKIKHLELLNLEYNYISNEYASKLEELPLNINLSERMENDEKWGNYPMLTE